MVVDDHELFAEGVARILSAEDDLEVVGVAGRVDAAIALASETRPDVVLVDFQLPDGEGTEAVASIRRDNPETRVLMLTGLGDERSLVAAVDAGCSGFLTKDRAVSDLVAAVRVAHSGDPYVQGEIAEAYVQAQLLTKLLSKLGRAEV
jgi:DNA-binding NarL/FixJ family response regulator